MKNLTYLILAGVILAGCSHKKTAADFQTYEGHNIVVKHGIVVSAHHQASEAGVSVLMKGGNAVDAAVATGFALAVCYPAAGNIGGGGFMVIRTASGDLDVIDYREKAPSGASRDMYLDNRGDVINNLSTDSLVSSGVPGSVDGMLTVHARYGKLSLKEIIQPAIDLAENGFILTSEQANSLNGNRENFIRRNRSATAFVKDTPWKNGDILKQPQLAETLERIRDNGRDGFYSGKTAELITGEMQKAHGLITKKDLEDYRTVFRKPFISQYKNYRLITVPPPSGGGIILFQVLGMISPYDLREQGFHSASAVHTLIEAERRAFADRAKYSGDPDFVKIPLNGMVNAGYLTERMKNFNPEKASLSADIFAGEPAGYESTETTHFSVADKDGNAVSVTTTLNNSYGNSIVVDGAGFLMNNEMDDFSVKPGFPNMYGLVGGEANSIAPGKRMLSSMTPVIVEKEGKLFLVAGSPGGSTIPTTVLQVLINVIDYNMKLSAAVDTFRFHHQWLPDRVSYEEGCFDTLTVNKLTHLGHELKLTQSLGRVNAVERRQDGGYEGAADRRGDNSACGY